MSKPGLNTGSSKSTLIIGWKPVSAGGGLFAARLLHAHGIHVLDKPLPITRVADNVFVMGDFRVRFCEWNLSSSDSRGEGLGAGHRDVLPKEECE